jgi:hypothetical protein
LDTRLSFEELRSARRHLRELCTLHVTSVEDFWDPKLGHIYPTNIPAQLQANQRRVRSGRSSRGVPHLTATATCLEGLVKFGTDTPSIKLPFAERSRRFADAAARWSDWTSKGEVRTYCRCRALPFVIGHVTAYQPNVSDLLMGVLEQLQDESRQAIGEIPNKPGLPYPPNAFHTYWCLLGLDSFEAKFSAQFVGFKRDFRIRLGLTLSRTRNAMIGWAWQVLGYQVALHSGGSPARDTDQLLWSLAIVTRFDRGVATASNLHHRDVVTGAIDCLFKAQDHTGTWPHGGPLFHYQASGTAYCYIFESFSILLECALRAEAPFVRSLLSRHQRRILKLVEYAESTATPLPSGGLGWTSGHQGPQHTAPESWATSSVFTFFQFTRCLLGWSAREDALKGLDVVRRPSTTLPPEDLIRHRGDTWSCRSGSHGSPGEHLLTRFVYPTLMAMNSRNKAETAWMRIDTDIPRINDGAMRSAILFGPPGTSKSTLVRATAAAIGWDYVEILASHFVADGIHNVHKRADAIFAQLAEIDQTVIFFDEFDELVRHRDGDTDTSSRFLTTSMLPKLAELWKSRRVLFFVATNHIGYFDDAATRGERFDALLFIPPPSFEAKRAELQRLLMLHEGLKLSTWSVESRSCISALEQAIKDAEQVPEDRPTNVAFGNERRRGLAKFAVLRFDELGALARTLSNIATGSSVTLDARLLTESLNALSIPRLDDPNTYRAFERDRRSSRVDSTKTEVWRISDGSFVEWARNTRAAAGSKYVPSRETGVLTSVARTKRRRVVE